MHGHFSTTGARILGARGMPYALHLWGPCYSEILSWYHSVIMASLPGVKRGGTRVLHNLGDGNVIITRHVVQHCTPLINFKVNSFSISCLFVARMLGHTACKASLLCVNANEIFFLYVNRLHLYVIMLFDMQAVINNYNRRVRFV